MLTATLTSSPLMLLAAGQGVSLAQNVAQFRAHLEAQGARTSVSWEGERGQLLQLPIPQQEEDFEAGVVRGLTDPTGKWIHTRFRYDERGSELYARICRECPDYYLTRTEAAILQGDASRIMEKLGSNRSLVEMGSGNSQKTRHLLAAWDVGHYVPVDISRSILVTTTPSLLGDFPNLWVSAFHAAYDGAFEALKGLALDLPISILFLGSNIGNFFPETRSLFFEGIAAVLQRGGLFAFGTDLHHDPLIHEAAYNDSEETDGLWTQFNLNVLERLNADLGADFDLEHFEYFAVYNEQEKRMEMYLKSLVAQEVHIGNHTITFEEGERIKMSFSYKFVPNSLGRELKEHRLEPIDFIRDPDGLFGFWITKRI